MIETQETEMMVKLKNFIEITAAPNKEKRLNWLSLELSQNRACEKLEDAIKIPYFVAETCIISQVTKELEERMKSKMKDKIKSYGKYLIMSVKGSLTDVHIDFSATSVYFHVVKGQKVFYVALPTKPNFQKYEVIERGQLQSGWKGHLFERDLARVVINAGETAFLPSGLLRCVYTPEDTIAISGGFLQTESSKRHFVISNFEVKLVQVGSLHKAALWENFHANMLTFVDLILLDKLKSGSSNDGKCEEHCEQGHIFLEQLTKYYTDAGSAGQKRKEWSCRTRETALKEERRQRKGARDRRRTTAEDGQKLNQFIFVCSFFQNIFVLTLRFQKKIKNFFLETRSYSI